MNYLNPYFLNYFKHRRRWKQRPRGIYYSHFGQICFITATIQRKKKSLVLQRSKNINSIRKEKKCYWLYNNRWIILQDFPTLLHRHKHRNIINLQYCHNSHYEAAVCRWPPVALSVSPTETLADLSAAPGGFQSPGEVGVSFSGCARWISTHHCTGSQEGGGGGWGGVRRRRKVFKCQVRGD